MNNLIKQKNYLYLGFFIFIMTQTVLLAKEKFKWVIMQETTLKEKKFSSQLSFIDFTADWCSTCQSHEKTILNTPDFQNLLLKQHIIPLKIDITKEEKYEDDYYKIFAETYLKFYNEEFDWIPAYGIRYPDKSIYPIYSNRILTKEIILSEIENASKKWKAKHK